MDEQTKQKYRNTIYLNVCDIMIATEKLEHLTSFVPMTVEDRDNLFAAQRQLARITRWKVSRDGKVEWVGAAE